MCLTRVYTLVRYSIAMRGVGIRDKVVGKGGFKITEKRGSYSRRERARYDNRTTYVYEVVR